MPVTPPFVLTLRMLVIALTHNEILNSTWVDSPDGPQVHVHRHVHLGFGVASSSSARRLVAWYQCFGNRRASGRR